MNKYCAIDTMAIFILLAVTLLADGLMDTFGLTGFILIVGPALLAAGLLVCWSDYSRKKKRRPRGGTPRSGKKPSRKAE